MSIVRLGNAAFNSELFVFAETLSDDEDGGPRLSICLGERYLSVSGDLDDLFEALAATKKAK